MDYQSFYKLTPKIKDIIRKQQKFFSCSNANAANTAADDAFIKCYLEHKKIDSIYGFYTLIRNHFLDYYRKEVKRENLFYEQKNTIISNNYSNNTYGELDDLFESAQFAEDIEDRIENNLYLKFYYTKILPSLQEPIASIIQGVISGKTSEEIGNSLGLHSGTVRTILYRHRKIWRKMLEDENEKERRVLWQSYS